MQALMLGKIADTILSQIEKLENENKELQDTIANEKAMQINYSYADIRKWLSHFRTLDYSKTKNRKNLIDTFIYIRAKERSAFELDFPRLSRRTSRRR